MRVVVTSALLLAAGCATAPLSPPQASSVDQNLEGAWRGRVQFKSGSFAAVKNLEFMYAFNAGGTMTESSNYDASPPVPPAYGVWKKVGPRQYQAKYTFFATKPPQALTDLTGGGGWSPGGSGVLVETIALSDDGNTFQSTIHLDLVDETGKPTETNSAAEADAVRIRF
jgi:hypothetical protein